MDISQTYLTPPPNYPRNRHRTHGLSVRPSIPQISSYLLIIGQMVIYFKCIFLNYPSYPMMVLYILFGIVMAISAGLSTIHNPTDKIVYYYKSSQNDSKIKFKCDFKELKYCNFCDSYCNKSSKHCKQCNRYVQNYVRCVPEFDHHCIWFNNCVGKQNYKTFFISIVFAFLHLLLFIIHGIVMSVYQNSLIEMKLGDLITVWIFLLILAIFQFLLLNLIALHIYLTYIGLTTYEFLKQTKSSEQKKQLIKKQQQRDVIEVNEIIQKQEDSMANMATIIRVSSLETSDSTNLHEKNQIRSQQIKKRALQYQLSRQNIIMEKDQQDIQKKTPQIQEKQSYKQHQSSNKSSQGKSQTVKENLEQANYQIQINQVLNIPAQVKSQYQEDQEQSQKTVKKRNRCRTIITYRNNEDVLNSDQKQRTNQKNYSNYFKNNRSFKFILNGDSPRAQSPRKQKGLPQRFSTSKKHNKDNQIQLFSFQQPTRLEPNND